MQQEQVDRVRILQVVHGWPPASMGGTGLYVDALTRALSSDEHTVGIVAPERGVFPGLRPTAHDGLLGWRLVTSPSISWTGGWRRTSGLRPWRKLLRSWSPDVVHVHHLSGLPLSLVATARAMGIHTVVTLHDYALPCARGQLVDRQQMPCSGPTPDRCAVCLFGPSAARGLRGLAARKRVRTRSEGVAHVFGATNCLLSPSKDLANRMAELGLPRPRTASLPLIRPPRPVVDPPEGPVRFLFASALIPTKGPHRVLDAFSRLPAGSTLTLAGPSVPYDGDLTYAQRLATKARDTPGVTWAGEVPPDEMPALLASHDVLLLPSIWPENSPLIVREAAAAGLRVIAGQPSGVAELAPTARLVSPGDDSALVNAMQEEVRRGRGRNAPVPSDTPEMHARWLVQHAYQPDDGDKRG